MKSPKSARPPRVRRTSGRIISIQCSRDRHFRRSKWRDPATGERGLRFSPTEKPGPAIQPVGKAPEMARQESGTMPTFPRKKSAPGRKSSRRSPPEGSSVQAKPAEINATCRASIERRTPPRPHRTPWRVPLRLRSRDGRMAQTGDAQYRSRQRTPANKRFATSLKLQAQAGAAEAAGAGKINAKVRSGALRRWPCWPDA